MRHPAPAEPRRPLGKVLLEWIKSIAFAVAILVPLRSSVADWNDVPSGSMEPTILPGDRIWVNKLAYGLRVPLSPWWVARWGTPARGEIVVLQSPRDGARLVKRVVAVEGDTVEVRAGSLLVNGVASTYRRVPPGDIPGRIGADRAWPGYLFADEDLTGRVHLVAAVTDRGASRWFGPVRVPAGSCFVMGDNRDLSGDSRVFGFVRADRVWGRVPGVAVSVDPSNWYLPRWGRWVRALR